MNSFRLQSNPISAFAHTKLAKTQFNLQNNIQRLSSGLRINSAADDSAGLSISTRMSNQINGMVQANRNTQDANNLIQTAESGLSDISGILSRMRELAVQASTDTLNDVDRASINFEFQTLKNELTRIANATEYNKMNVLNGTYQTGTSEVGSYAPNSQSHIDRVAQDNPNDFNLSERGFWQLQVGADNDANNQIKLSIINATAEGLGLTKYDYQPQQVQKVNTDGELLYLDSNGNETTSLTFNSQKVDIDGNLLYIDADGLETTSLTSTINSTKSMRTVDSANAMETINNTNAMETINNANAMETINNAQAMETINNAQAMETINNAQAMETINNAQAMETINNAQAVENVQKVDAEGNLLYIGADGNETTNLTSTIQKVDADGNLLYIDANGNETTNLTSTIQKVDIDGALLYIGADGNETTNSTHEAQKADANGNLLYIVDGLETTSPTYDRQNGPVMITVDNTAAMVTTDEYQKSITYNANVLTVDDSRQVITTLDNAIDEINQERSYLGSMQNKLQFTMSNLTSQIQSIESSRSSIEDVDFAAEASDLAKNQILAQSATAMLAQASAISQNILSLIAA